MNKSEYNLWKTGPGPLNPEYKSASSEVCGIVTASMDCDDFYYNHTREECSVEWIKRYEKEIKKY